MVTIERTRAFLFPGQGAQYPGMGLDIMEASTEAKKVFAIGQEVLGKDLAGLIRDSDAETLKRTDVSQIAITAASLVAYACLKERGITPAACAGFSLGEYPALACAGIISLEDCFRLTSARGKAMQEAVDKLRQKTGETAEAPGMAAVLGLTPEQVEALIAEWKSAAANGGAIGGAISELYAANINSPKQTVVSGGAAALAEAKNLFILAGAKRFVQLEVAGPFHSPFMKEAAEAFAPELEKITFNDPLIPVFSNVTGKQLLTGAEAKALALRHITEGVRWTDEEAAILAVCTALDACLEVGPGKTLQGLWRDSGSEIPCFAAGTMSDIEKII